MIRLPGATRARVGITTAMLVSGVTAAVAGAALSPEESSPSRSENQAFVDTEATERVLQDVTASATAVFTIRPDAVGATRRQARKLLVGDAVEQYDRLYGSYLRRAKEEGLTLETAVRATGVTWLDDDEARLLMLADQAGVTASGQTGAGPAQLVLEARLVDGQWKIASIALL